MPLKKKGASGVHAGERRGGVCPCPGCGRAVSTPPPTTDFHVQVRVLETYKVPKDMYKDLDYRAMPLFTKKPMDVSGGGMDE